MSFITSYRTKCFSQISPVDDTSHANINCQKEKKTLLLTSQSHLQIIKELEPIGNVNGIMSEHEQPLQASF